MKKSIGLYTIVVIVGYVCGFTSAQQLKQPSEPKFRVYDTVKITKGFYKDCIGQVYGYYSKDNNYGLCIYCYDPVRSRYTDPSLPGFFSSSELILMDSSWYKKIIKDAR